jgi:pimeloyl-ACP methyl ester carboxylesterase
MSREERLARELRWQVDGRTLAGQSWGEAGDKPLLALHGWLDNSASFALLAPLLHGYHVVAPDLSGHGRSDPRSADAGYQIWDDLPELHQIIAELGWERFAVLGHSRGAIIGALLAATLADRISHLVLLDAIVPEPFAEEAIVSQLQQFLLDRRRLLTRDNRVFASADAAVTARQEHGIGFEAARLLATRNLRPSEGGVTWTTDPRLYGASAVKLTAAQTTAVVRALTMPTLLLLADRAPGGAHTWAGKMSAELPDGTSAVVAGGHHFHMDGDLTSLARQIQDFIMTNVRGTEI